MILYVSIFKCPWIITEQLQIKDAGFDIKADEERMLTEEQIRVFYARNKDEVKSN